jgi:hypothetical protein
MGYLKGHNYPSKKKKKEKRKEEGTKKAPMLNTFGGFHVK